ncbi:hypothetical protein pdam_00017603, partial [Pocillopora damicornis]
MLCSCDVENCDDTSATMAEKGKNSKNRRTYCLAGAPTDVSYKNNTHIPLYGQKGRVSIVDIEDILLFNVVGLIMPRSGFEDTSYEHISQVKLE